MGGAGNELLVTSSLEPLLNELVELLTAYEALSLFLIGPRLVRGLILFADGA